MPGRRERTMRVTIKDFAALAAKTLPVKEPVYEFGALQVPGQEGRANLRALFPGKRYVGADMQVGPGVDEILNLHEIALPAASAGTVICLDTFEHVEYPHRAMEEIHRILKPDGLALVSSVMQFPIHDYPHDYWRFTPEAFRSLLKPFADCFVGSVGKENFPHTVIGVGFKGAAPDLSAFTRDFEAWKHRQEHPRHETLKKLATSLSPPVLLPCLRGLYRIAFGTPSRKPASAGE